MKVTAKMFSFRPGSDWGGFGFGEAKRIWDHFATLREVRKGVAAILLHPLTSASEAQIDVPLPLAAGGLSPMRDNRCCTLSVTEVWSHCPSACEAHGSLRHPPPSCAQRAHTSTPAAESTHGACACLRGHWGGRASLSVLAHPQSSPEPLHCTRHQRPAAVWERDRARRTSQQSPPMPLNPRQPPETGVPGGHGQAARGRISPVKRGCRLLYRCAGLLLTTPAPLQCGGVWGGGPPPRPPFPRVVTNGSEGRRFISSIQTSETFCSNFWLGGGHAMGVAHGTTGSARRRAEMEDN